MPQILDPIPTNRSYLHIVCCYVNATNKIQIARITNVQNWYFERVVFPGQRLVFEAFSEAVLEIHTGMMASAILSDKIPCSRLQVSEQTNPTNGGTAELKPESTHIKQEIESTKKSRQPRPMAVALTSID